jgi:excisionase family DNA binding protein
VRPQKKKKHAAQRLLKRNEVAQHLGVRVETVSRWTTAGTLPCVRIGKRSVRYLLPQIVNRLTRRNKGGRK